uniref:T-cell surface glycoprotein CD4-like n=1 Tax=Astyanax mexicanus TaxID=7994 RepID=A0A3B1IDF2_ASTMX
LFLLSFSALCVAMGGCDVFYNKTGDVVSMDCGTANSNKPIVEQLSADLNVLIQLWVEYNICTIYLSLFFFFDVFYLKLYESVLSFLILFSASASPSETVLHSTDLTLTCDINNSPTAQIRWMNKNKNTYESPGKSISLKSVKSTDSGRWTCQIEDNKRVETLVVDIAVLGSADLTCSLPSVSLPHVETGGWSHDCPSGLKFPTLQRGPEWKGENNSRVTFNKGNLKNDFKVTLNKVRMLFFFHICSVQLTQTSLTVPVTSLDTPLLILWIWVGAAAALVLLIGLIIIIVLIHRRNKRMRVRKLRSVRQGLTPKNYCQCDRYFFSSSSFSFNKTQAYG